MYDVVFIADIYVPGGTNFQLARNIRYLHGIGKRIGVLPVQLPHAQGQKAISRFVREVISERLCEIVDATLDHVSTAYLFIDNPRLMAPDLKLKTRITAGRTVILVPFPIENGNGHATFNPAQVLANARKITDGEAIWAPVSNLVRAQLSRHVPDLPLTELNAHPIVDTSAYRFSADMRHRKTIAIGRHSRPEPDKWPASRGQFLKIYPGAAPFSVSLLGIDAASLSRMIGAIPSNYRVLPFDSTPVPEFLQSIDFFAYFHSKSWVEAFGIVVAEAMASGALCVLPRYMEANFGDAAIYASPNEVRAELIRLHRNPRRYRERTRYARSFVKRSFSADRFGAFVEEIGIAATRTARSARPHSSRHGTVFLADFASANVCTTAFADDVAARAEGGGKTTIVDMRDGQVGFTPAAARLLSVDGIRLLAPSERIACDRLVVHEPWKLAANSVDLARIAARETTCVASTPTGDLGAVQRYLGKFPSFQPDTVTWAPCDAYTRMWLEQFDPNLRIAATNWVTEPGTETREKLALLRQRRPITLRRTIGFIGVSSKEDGAWVNGLVPTLNREPSPTLTCFGARASAALDPQIVSIGYLGLDLVKWIAKLDRLVVVGDRLKHDNLDYAVALCRLADVPVVYRSRHNKQRMTGAKVLEGMAKADVAETLLGASTAPPRAAATALGEPPTPVREVLAAPADRGNGQRRGKPRPALLFVSQNGTGVGHVVRLLAIARQLASTHDCIFLTMSQALPFISAFGFHAEYFPSAVYSGVSYTDWVHWLRKKVELMLDAWGVRTVVFDGNVPYAAVIEAAGHRSGVSSVWIRRGMWPDSAEDRKRLRSQAYFDMVIEPRDFADDLDEGPTRPLRDTVHLVPPIQLLSRSEMLSRREACAELAVDPDETNILVQLGSGNNRDTQTLLRCVVATVKDRPDVHVYNLRWPISDVPPTSMPNVTDIAIFPVARFYRAFDFSVAAAGYNTAHEVLSHRLPTIFVPNSTEGMDNQAGRADFSAARGLSLAGGAPALVANIHRMLEVKVRQKINDRLRRLNLENGAAAAAGWIEQLAWESHP